MNVDKVAVLGPDFEQSIHRGLTFYSKSLVRCLKDMGFSVSIVTSCGNISTTQLCELLIVRMLDNPQSPSRKNLLISYLKRLLFKSCDVVETTDISFDMKGKLNYLEYVDSYINIQNIYKLMTLNTIVFDRPLSIDVENVQMIFCTCPCSLKTKTNIKLVQTLHDVIPLRRIDHPDDPKIFYSRIKNMLNYSDLVVSVSDFSKQECLELFPSYEKKIVTVYQPVPVYEVEENFAMNPLVEDAVLLKYKLEKNSYLLFVSTVEPRKNVKGLIQAYLAIKDKIQLPLVIVGGIGTGSEDLGRYLANKKDSRYRKDKFSILHLDYINTVDKLVLLRNALAFLFPSFYEGFGLPPVEAMRMGCPVLTSNVTSLPEICGDAALLVDPHKISEIAEGIIEIVNNSSMREELKSKGATRSDYFSFMNHEERLDRVLRSI